MTRVKPFHHQTPLTVMCPAPNQLFLLEKKKPKQKQNPKIFTFMVSELRKYRTELKKALKWPPPPQRRKSKAKLVMSWSLCECLAADATRGEHARTHFSLAGNHCSASRNQPRNLLHARLSNSPPPQTHPGSTLDAEGKKKKFPPIPPALAPLPSVNQTPKSGGGKGAEEEGDRSAPLHHCVATKRRSAARSSLPPPLYN